MSTDVMQYPVYSSGFWSRYYIHMRPYLLYISGIAGLTGMALIPDPDILHVVIGLLPLFFAYGMGQALTDVFQVDTDAISSPYRPLVKGEISKKAVFLVSNAGLILGVLILALMNIWLLIPGLLSIVGLATYTPFKRTWWGGPPWNSWIVALLPVMGRMIDTGFHPMAVFFPPKGAGLPLFYATGAIFFAYANFVVGGYFKDISADRETDYQTFQVRFGWFAGAVYSDLLAGLSVVFTGLAILPVIRTGASAGMIAAGLLVFTAVLNAIAQIKLHLTSDEDAAHGPIATIVRSFILYCIVIILAYKLHWWPALCVFYILFELTLKYRPAKSQV